VSIAALIVAAGRGTRAADGPGRPKQYRPIGGVPVLARSIDAFATHQRISEILVVIDPDHARFYEDATRSFAERLRPPVPAARRS
jgi:2-C-methyl-D-erythritol 4-phosphate cytidylyltransferase/2-C-methyl-D-erythritol 2,4-cyclodiphosphate synthase